MSKISLYGKSSSKIVWSLKKVNLTFLQNSITEDSSEPQWIPHDFVDRTKLGVDRHNQPDEVSGLFQSETDIENLQSGQVALLKGERREGNEGAGLVHRSPSLDKGERRFLLSLDFA